MSDMAFCLGMISRVAPLTAVISSAVSLLPLNQVYFQNFLTSRKQTSCLQYLQKYICVVIDPSPKWRPKIQIS